MKTSNQNKVHCKMDQNTMELRYNLRRAFRVATAEYVFSLYHNLTLISYPLKWFNINLEISSSISGNYAYT